MNILAENRKARFDYEILEKYEAGIQLNGQEVKSIRTRGASLSGNYVMIRNIHGHPEIFWIGANIPPYQPENITKDYAPQRDRKLLLHKKEISYLAGKTKEKGLTLVPLLVYTKNHKIKMEIGLAKGKKAFSKREAIKEREVSKHIRQALKTRG